MPETLWRTFGVLERILVPLPAPMIIAEEVAISSKKHGDKHAGLFRFGSGHFPPLIAVCLTQDSGILVGHSVYCQVLAMLFVTL